MTMRHDSGYSRAPARVARAGVTIVLIGIPIEANVRAGCATAELRGFP